MTTELKPLGNTQLVSYGIHSENSDLRAHVCVNAGMVYVYPTRKGIDAIKNGNYRLARAYQKGILTPTAEGFLVPPEDIWGLLSINAKWAMEKAGHIDYGMSTSAKGAWAVNVVRNLLAYGYFPLWGNSEVIDDLDIQIKGVDIIVTARARIQVKCDFDGGSPRRHGPEGNRVTGNLFLQVAECNPFRRN